jgi:hypothetical protein
MASITLNRAKQNMADASVPMATLAQIAGLRPTSMSSVFRGTMTLDSNEELRLFTLSCRVLELKIALDPVRLPDDWRDVAKMVAALEDQRVSLDEIRAAVSRMVGSSGL